MRKEQALNVAAAAATLTYRCVGCGGVFTAPVASYSRDPAARPCVLLGGRRWCSECAAARTSRRKDPDAPLGAESAPLPQWLKT